MSNTEIVKGFGESNKAIFGHFFKDKETGKKYNAMWNDGEIGILSCDDDSGDNDFNIAIEIFDKNYIYVEC